MNADGIGFWFISVRQWCDSDLLPLLPEFETFNDLLDITPSVKRSKLVIPLSQSSDGVNFAELWLSPPISSNFRDLKSQNFQRLRRPGAPQRGPAEGGATHHAWLANSSVVQNVQLE